MPSDPTGWPDASKPGVPLDPEKHGWHWLAWDATWPEPAYWDGEWSQPDKSNISVRTARYLGPCPTPQEVAARVEAAAVAMRKACEAIAAGYRIDDGSWSWRNGQEHAADKIARRIGNTTTPTDALAAALAQAKREGMEEAARIAAKALADTKTVSENPGYDAETRRNFHYMGLCAKELADAIRAKAGEVQS